MAIFRVGMWVMTPDGVGILTALSGEEAAERVVGATQQGLPAMTAKQIRPWLYAGKENKAEVNLTDSDGATIMTSVTDQDGNAILVSSSWYDMALLKIATIADIPAARIKGINVKELNRFGYK